eukprot:CAMPEP_0197852294 /NCGR_PEP_ID=MMETSP1438-20131217/20201_1 /TAXON_ID=1461541 /ORGANISM="Pterosperma sp., Strain CCMP1384" /LENGTH=103 /DNA_ID=CAMNT_0043466267 /DNA_START=108 /DNA_END=415 /DNA_ORIENTATION=-
MVGGASMPSLCPVASISMKLQDGTEVNLDCADSSSARSFAQGPLLEWYRQQVASEQASNEPAASAGHKTLLPRTPSELDKEVYQTDQFRVYEFKIRRCSKMHA